MLKKEHFNAKQNTEMGQIPRSIERISSLPYFSRPGTFASESKSGVELSLLTRNVVVFTW